MFSPLSLTSPLMLPRETWFSSSILCKYHPGHEEEQMEPSKVFSLLSSFDFSGFIMPLPQMTRPRWQIKCKTKTVWWGSNKSVSQHFTLSCTMGQGRWNSLTKESLWAPATNVDLNLGGKELISWKDRIHRCQTSDFPVINERKGNMI